MLLLYIFLLSCCLPGSMGSATEEFKENFEALVALASEEVFLPVPVGKFQCNHVPCQLERTIKWLKDYFKNDQTRTPISLMEKNTHHIISTLNKARMKPEKDSSCPTGEMPPRRALKRYKKFFQMLQEEC